MIEQRAKRRFSNRFPRANSILENAFHFQKNPDVRIVGAIERGLGVLNRLYPQQFNSVTVKLGTSKNLPDLYSGVAYFSPSNRRRANTISLADTWDQYDFTQTTPFAIEHIASLLNDRGLGIDVQTIAQHRELLATFFLFHEFGHAHQYINFFEKLSREKEWGLNNERELSSLPFPNHTPGEIITQRGILLKLAIIKHLKTHNITLKEMVSRQIEKYITLESEAYADKFAADTIVAALDELGFGDIRMRSS